MSLKGFPFGSATILLFILTAVIGICFGLGTTTFLYAKGFSYFSSDPAACANCHVMNPQYESWMKSGHQHVAACNDCHVPKDFLGKWYTKAENGFHHSWAFTFSDVPVNIKAREASREVVQNNCIYCHSKIASNVVSPHHQLQDRSMKCISCHTSVGHGG